MTLGPSVRDRGVCVKEPGMDPGRPAPLGGRRSPTAPLRHYRSPLPPRGLSSPQPRSRPRNNTEDSVCMGGGGFALPALLVLGRVPRPPGAEPPTSAACDDQPHFAPKTRPPHCGRRPLPAAPGETRTEPPAAGRGSCRAGPRCGLPPVAPRPRSAGSRRGGCAALRMSGRRRKGS